MVTIMEDAITFAMLILELPNVIAELDISVLHSYLRNALVKMLRICTHSMYIYRAKELHKFL